MSLFDNPFDPAREAALVTGAGNGIGRAIAQALVGEGVRTVFADISEDRVTAAIKDSPRPELATPWIGDLADRAAREGLLAHTRSTLGQVTHFVHSASPPRREADHALAVDDETWRQMHAVNLEAGFHLSRELARGLIAAKTPGSILLLTSLHADTPRNLPHYSSTKAGMAMLVKELAKSFGRYNIRVNALVPGAIAAGGFVADPQLARHIPLGRLGEAKGPRADGARGALQQAIGLCHGRRHRRRWRARAHQLVRPAGIFRTLTAIAVPAATAAAPADA